MASRFALRTLSRVPLQHLHCRSVLRPTSSLAAAKPVLLQSNFWHGPFFSKCCGLNLDDYETRRIADVSPESFDAEREINALRSMVSSGEVVPKVLCMGDNLNTVYAMTIDRLKKECAEKYGHMRGASLNGTILCNFKLLTRALVPRCGSIGFKAVSAEDKTIPPIQGLPEGAEMILKPVAGNSSAGVKRVFAGQENAYYGLKTEDIGVLEKATLPYVEELGKDVPGSKDCICVLEEYVPSQKARRVSVDAIIVGRDIVPWCISDNVHKKGDPETFDSLEVPSMATTPSEQAMIWEAFREVCIGLHDLTDGDMNAQFICIEFFVFNDESRVEVLEINPRISSDQLPAFHRVLDGGCPFAAKEMMQEGPVVQKPNTPTHNGLHCCALYCEACDIPGELMEATIEDDGYEAQYYRMDATNARCYGYGETPEKARFAAESLFDKVKAEFGLWKSNA